MNPQLAPAPAARIALPLEGFLFPQGKGGSRVTPTLEPPRAEPSPALRVGLKGCRSHFSLENLHFWGDLGSSASSELKGI